MNNPTPITTISSKDQSNLKVSFHMERRTYEAIHTTLEEISSQCKIQLNSAAVFSRKVQENWKMQAERYRKLDSRLRRKKSEATEATQANLPGAAAPPPFPKVSLTPASAPRGP